MACGALSSNESSCAHLDEVAVREFDIWDSRRLVGIRVGRGFPLVSSSVGERLAGSKRSIYSTLARSMVSFFTAMGWTRDNFVGVGLSVGRIVSFCGS